MPRIPNELLGSILYLYPSVNAAKNGERAGASGCLVSMKYKDELGQSHAYAVTNAHVIERGSTIIRLNTKAGSYDILSLKHDDWILHPQGDDIAVAPLDDLDEFEVIGINSELFVTENEVGLPGLETWGPGDECFFVGRYVDHEGKERNTPVVRFGNVSLLPSEPVKQKDRGGRLQESFGVEARSLSGFSGSPVFVWRGSQFVGSTKPGQVTVSPVFKSDLKLLGLDWGHHAWTDKVVDARGKPVKPALYVKSNSGLMFVVPAWKVMDILNLEELVELRAKEEQRRAIEVKERDQGPVMDSIETYRSDDFLRDLRKATGLADQSDPGGSKTSA